MKSERRHELQTNDLADRLGEGLEKYGDRLKLGLAAGVGLFAIIIAVLFISGQQSSKQASLWTVYFAAVNTPDSEGIALETAAADFVDRGLKDSQPALWTRITLADIKLMRASAERFTSKTRSMEELEVAKGNFEAVRNSPQAGNLLKMRATYGLAMVHETECEPDLAKKYLEEVKQKAGETALGKAATDALARIDELSAQGWYVWFKDQEMTPPEPIDPNLPDSLEDLPDRPNLEFGNLGPAGPLGPGPDDAATPENGEAQSSETAPNENEKPDAEKPDAEKPVGEETPKPTDDKPTDEEAKPEPAKDDAESSKGDKPEGEADKPESDKPEGEAKKPDGETPKPADQP